MGKYLLAALGFFVVTGVWAEQISYNSRSPLFNVSFEEDTVGQQPVTEIASSNIINTHPSPINGAVAGILVKDGFTDSVNSDSFLSSNVVVFDGMGVFQTLETKLYGHSDDLATSGTVVIQWDMLVDTNASVDKILFRASSSNEAIPRVAEVQFFPSTNKVLLANGDEEGKPTVWQLYDQAFKGERLRVQWRLNLHGTSHTDSHELWIDRLDGAGFQFIARLPGLRINSTFDRLQIFAIGIDNQAFALDNIKITNEPATQRFAVDFDLDTEGSLPSTVAAQPGDLNTRPTSSKTSTEITSHSTMELMVDSLTAYSLGGSDVDGNLVDVIIDSIPGGNADVPIQFRDSDLAVAKDGSVIIRWEMLIDSNTNGTTPIKLQALNGTNSSGQSKIALIHWDANNNTITLHDFPDSGNGTSVNTEMDFKGKTILYEWRLDLTLRKQILSWSIDGIESNSLTHNLRNGSEYQLLQFVAGQGTSKFGIDNIEIVHQPKVRAIRVGVSEFLAYDKQHKLIDTIAQTGYNTVIFSVSDHYDRLQTADIGKESGISKDELAGLISHARRVGLIPIMHINIIGKMTIGIEGSPLLERHPELLLLEDGTNSKIINIGYKSGSDDVYTLVLFPLIDEMLTVFGPVKPQYLHLGMDEMNVDDIKYYAGRQENGNSAAQLLAEGMNRVFDHVLNKAITPIIWGDMLLSKNLSISGHGVIDPATGLERTPDEKFSISLNYNAEHKTNLDVSVLTTINDLNRKNEVVIADWHYFRAPTVNNNEYPSVDYFQAMGFKDVWGSTWYQEDAIQNFAAYADKRQTGGMMATAWGSSSWAIGGLKNIGRTHWTMDLYNSLAYFNDPALTPPLQQLPVTFEVAGQQFSIDEDRPATFFSDGTNPPEPAIITINLPLGFDTSQITDSKLILWANIDPVLLKQGSQVNEIIVPLQINGNTLTGIFEWDNFNLFNDYGFPRFYDTRIEIRYNNTPYVTTDSQRKSVAVINTALPVAGIASDTALYSFNFSELSNTTLQDQNWLAGADATYESLLYLKNPTAAINTDSNGGYLDTDGAEEAYTYLPRAMWDDLYRNGMKMRFEMFVENGNWPNTYYSVISHSHSHRKGFRILLAGRPTGNHLLLQVGGTLSGSIQPTWIWTDNNTPFPQGEWVTVELELTSPDLEQKREATLRVVNYGESTETLLYDIIPTFAPLGLGTELSDPFMPTITYPNNEAFDNLPGRIRRFEILPLNGVFSLDQDDDGFNDIEEGGTDCNDGDPTIYPGATEIFNDGIDQNCNGPDATIDTSATYSIKGRDGTLDVEVIISGTNDQLTVSFNNTDYQMEPPKRNSAKWTLKVTKLSINPGTILITGSEGIIEVNVTTQ